jgi:predicted metal-dependent hydrolase
MTEACASCASSAVSQTTRPEASTVELATVGRVDELVEVLRSPRARRWRLTAPWGEPARLTVPRSMSRREIDRVVATHRDWLARERARQVPRLDLPSRSVNVDEGRQAARELVKMVASDEAAVLGVSYSRIAIRDQRTRWGSCSSRGTLSFNWRLALAPFEVLDYVVVHELCHLCHPNHSPDFWRLVSARRPDWRVQRAWLREHGSELLAFRPST